MYLSDDTVMGILTNIIECMDNYEFKEFLISQLTDLEESDFQNVVSKVAEENDFNLQEDNLNELNNLERLTVQWSKDRKIIPNGTIPTQTLKLISEVGELADNVIKGKDIRDDIGDCLVLLTNIAALYGTNLTECWEIAYDDIKDREGVLLESGTFLKSTDPEYIKLKEEGKI
jgi:hypothetical protein